MLKHADIWSAIDRLAQDNGLTASGLARRAGLDPTTFNRSKRVTREGKPRWPSTESIAKILDATGTSVGRFVSLMRPEQSAAARRTVPLASLKEIRGLHFNASGHPAGENWDEISLPDVVDPHAFAIEVTENGLEPVYHDGDILIVSPAAAPRRGDRVFVRTAGGDVLIRRLLRRTAKRIDLQSLAESRDEVSLRGDNVVSLARIVWVSQ